MATKKLQKQLEAKLVQLQKIRDQLQGIADEASEQLSTVERAKDSLNDALDALSELA